MKKILTTLFLALLIVSAAALPLTAEAAPLSLTVSNWTQFVNAFSTAKENADGGTITLTGNITSPDGTDSVLTAVYQVTIDTGSYTLSIESSSAANPSQVTIGSNVTITNSGYYAGLNAGSNGTVCINGGEVTKTTDLAAVKVESGGNLIVVDGVISGLDGVDVKDGGIAVIGGGRITTNKVGSVGVHVRQGANVLIDGSASIEANGNSSFGVYTEGALTVTGSPSITGGGDGVCVYGTGTANIGSGTITGGSGGVFSFGDITINGGTITATGTDGTGVYVAGGAVAHIGGNADITGGATGSGIEVEAGGKADISDGEISSGSVGVYASGEVDISGGDIQGSTDSGVRIGVGGKATVTGGAIYGNVNGILVGSDELGNGGDLAVSGGSISGENYGVVAGNGNGAIDIRGGDIEGIGVGSIGISVSGGTLTVYDGTISGVENGISLGSASMAIIYKGTISATGGVSPYSIYNEGDVPLTLYSAATLNGDIYFDSESPENFTELDSFDVISPSTVELTQGENESVEFMIEGQKLDESLIALQDLLGGSGALSNATYTVSGNTVTFTPTAAGDDTLTINDDITYNGERNITVYVGAAAADLNIITASLPSGKVGSAYNAGLAAGGGMEPYTWSASGLPAGLDINTVTGTVYGTPTTAGTSTVTVTVHDSASQSVNKIFSLTVNPASSGGGGGGGSSSPLPVTSTTGSASVYPGAGGTISLGSEAGVEIPAGALQGSSTVLIKIEKTIEHSAAPSGFRLGNNVFRVTADGKDHYQFNKPVTLTFTFDPSALAPGEKPEIFYYDEASSQWVSLGGTVSGNTITVTVNHFTKFAVLVKQEDQEDQQEQKEQKPEEKPVLKLTDISGHWAENNISRLAGLGAISGYPDGTFKPDGAITRAEFAAVLVKAFKLEARQGKVFSDTAGHWAGEAIATAAAHGIISGYSDTAFGPDDPVTREQMAVMIVKAAQLETVTEKPTFADSADISPWAEAAVAAAAENGIIKGYPDNAFRPAAGVTRAEAATAIVNAVR